MCELLKILQKCPFRRKRLPLTMCIMLFVFRQGSKIYLLPFWLVQDKSDIEKTLEEEARKCQWLVLWLDCDREGENIAFEVVEVCTRANPNLNIWRARFSALIDRFYSVLVYVAYLFYLYQCSLILIKLRYSGKYTMQCRTLFGLINCLLMLQMFAK